MGCKVFLMVCWEIMTSGNWPVIFFFLFFFFFFVHWSCKEMNDRKERDWDTFKLWCGMFSRTCRNNRASTSRCYRNHFGKLWIVGIEYKGSEGPPWVFMISQRVFSWRCKEQEATGINRHVGSNWLLRGKGSVCSVEVCKGIYGTFSSWHLEANLFRQRRIALPDGGPQGNC